MPKKVVLAMAVAAISFFAAVVPFLGEALSAWQWKGLVVNLWSGGDVVSHVRVETKGFLRDANLSATRGDGVAKLYDPSLREVSVETYPTFWEFALFDRITLGSSTQPTRTWTVHTFRLVDIDLSGKHYETYRIRFCNVVRYSGRQFNRPDEFYRDCKKLDETPPEIVEIYQQGAKVAERYRGGLPKLPTKI